MIQLGEVESSPGKKRDDQFQCLHAALFFSTRREIRKDAFTNERWMQYAICKSQV